MSTFDIEMSQHKGFVKTFFAHREDFYWNTHMTPARPHFSRFAGRHRNRILGATRGAYCKQFDTTFYNYCKHFKSHTSIPKRFHWESYTLCFRFGKKGKKFQYK